MGWTICLRPRFTGFPYLPAAYAGSAGVVERFADAAFDDGPFSFHPDGDVAVDGSPQRGAGLRAKRGAVIDLAGADELRTGIALEGR